MFIIYPWVIDVLRDFYYILLIGYFAWMAAAKHATASNCQLCIERIEMWEHNSDRNSEQNDGIMLSIITASLPKIWKSLTIQ